MRDFTFSDGQDLGNLTATGVVSDRVFDMELTASGGSTIIQDDQLVGWLNIKLLSIGNTSGGTSGINIYLRSCDNANMTSSPVQLAMIFIPLASFVTGGIFSVAVHVSLSQKFVGLFYDPVSETLNGTNNTLDSWMDTAPLTLNDAIQKVPS